MSGYVDTEVTLPKYLWTYLERLSRMNNITLNKFVNDILSEGLDQLDESSERMNKFLDRMNEFFKENNSSK